MLYVVLSHETNVGVWLGFGSGLLLPLLQSGLAVWLVFPGRRPAVAPLPADLPRAGTLRAFGAKASRSSALCKRHSPEGLADGSRGLSRAKPPVLLVRRIIPHPEGCATRTVLARPSGCMRSDACYRGSRQVSTPGYRLASLRLACRARGIPKEHPFSLFSAQRLECSEFQLLAGIRVALIRINEATGDENESSTKRERGRKSGLGTRPAQVTTKTMMNNINRRCLSTLNSRPSTRLTLARLRPSEVIENSCKDTPSRRVPPSPTRTPVRQKPNQYRQHTY